MLENVHNQSVKIINEMTDEQLHKIAKTPWGFEQPAIGLLWGMRDHMIHHRGQLFVYVRLKGLKPPPFIEMH
ncbi:MAG: DinB family protein [bacterium]|nr:DinB family protein [bacterium]